MIHKLYKGSKNPPLDTPILLQDWHGRWGIGKVEKFGKRLFFSHVGFGFGFLEVDKDNYKAWQPIQTQ